MAVYVDNGRIPYRGMRMCHMLADSLEELHAMADRLGLKQTWFQSHSTPHYDICQSKRALALRLGAIPADRRQVVTLIRRWRAELEKEAKSAAG